MHRNRLTFACITLFSLALVGCSKNVDMGDYVTVTAQNFRMPIQTSEMIRPEVDISLLIENTGSEPITYDTISSQFFLLDNKCCEDEQKLVAPVILKPAEQRKENVKGHFGLSAAHQSGREVMVSFLNKGQRVLGPVALNVPMDLKP